MKASVLLISFNGIRYIEKQIISILQNIDFEDELIISDDGSTDGTIELIEEYKEKYPNIMLVKGPHKGIAANLSNAFSYSTGEIVLFSDQDDEWLQGKVKAIKDTFERSKVDVIMHDGYICNENNDVIESDNTIFIKRKARHGVFPNIIKSTYYGCCMAFRRSFLQKYMPLPDNLLAYDQFLGLCAERIHSVMFIDKPYIKHRYHNANQSNRQPLYKQIKYRFVIIIQFIRNRKGKLN